MVPWAILWMVFLSGGTPSGGADLEGLLATLDDDQIERREAAQAQLVALGRPAVPALQAAFAAPMSSEARLRLGEVLHGLLPRDPTDSWTGGEVQGDLSAAVRVSGQDSSGIVLEVEIRNVGRAPAGFVPIRWWNLSLPTESFVSNLSEGRMEVRPISGPYPGRVERSRLCVPGPFRRSRLELGPGDSRCFRCRLDPATLAPGEYSVRFEYFSQRLLGSPGNLESNVVTFAIDR
jgi:hypothetical protein